MVFLNFCNRSMSSMDDLTHNSEIGKANSREILGFPGFLGIPCFPGNLRNIIFNWNYYSLLHLGSTKYQNWLFIFLTRQLEILRTFLMSFLTVLPGNSSDNIPGKLFPGHYIPTQKYYVDTIRVQSLPSKILFFHACSPPPPTQDFFCQYVLRTKNLLWSFKVKLILL